MQFGIDSFVEHTQDPVSGATVTAAERMQQLIAEAVCADVSGLDVVAIGEHHRGEYLASSPAVVLAAIATCTKKVRLASAVTVLGSDDPVRVFQSFATVDLVSNGRAEIIAGRGSFIESFPLFGYDLDDYDAVFAEKLDLLLALRDHEHVTWSGKFRPALTGQGVYPRPAQASLPVWLGVGGTPQSFVRAGVLGLPLMIAIIGGEPHRFRPLVDLYREAGKRAGHPPERLAVGVHVHGFLADDDATARELLFPYHAAAFTRIGRERGWPPTTRAHYDAMSGPTGSLFVGSAKTVIDKVRHIDRALGGVARLTMLMTPATMPHDAVLRSIAIFGRDVASQVNA